MEKRKNRGGRKKGTASPQIFSFIGLDGKEYKLTPLQKRFCDYFFEFDYNSTDAAIEAGYKCFHPDGKTPNRKVAGVVARENLQKPVVIAYIAKKFEDMGLNDQIVNKHLLFNIVQFADLRAKNKAIDIYKRTKGQYAPEKHKHVIETVEIVKYGDAKDKD